MRAATFNVAYMPLVDAAPLIVAREMGFAGAEGLDLNLVAAPSWSSVRDMLAFGSAEAAHLLSPVPAAMALGLGGVTTRLAAVSVLSANGTVLGVSRVLEARLRAAGYAFDFEDAARAGAALADAAPGGLVVGVPFPFSMHCELVRYWCAATPLAGVPVDLRVVPPPLMARTLAAGEIDAFCVGEPWGSVAVEIGAGALLLPGCAIWGHAPEKVLAVRADWALAEPDLLGRLMRAVWRAGRWLSRKGSLPAAAALLARRDYLDMPAEIVDRALSGRFAISGQGELRRVEDFVKFHQGAVNFPWRSQAKWIGRRIAARAGLDPQAGANVAAGVFRSDLYRQHMAVTEADLPGASEKLEGALTVPTAVASQSGRLILRPDRFFDGQIFDPYAP